MKQLLLVLGLFVSTQAFAQFAKLSEKAEVSIITVGPGANLYDCFGHSAFRIIDPELNLDRAYNYGTYDFSESGFYRKFSMGIANYKLSAYDFTQFYNNYVRENRWVTEQVLNLSQEEKQAIFDALETNHLPQNQSYRYDPFFDNCATKMRDVVKGVLKERIIFDNSHLNGSRSIRDLVDENSFNHPWWDLGMDVALGNIIDKTATPEEYMYLPDYVLAAYENATISRGGEMAPAVKQTRNLYTSNYYEERVTKTSPTLIFILFAMIITLFTAWDYRRKKRARWMDFLLMCFTGLLGVLFLFLWFGTYHSTTINNLNILWAFAPNLIVAFYIVRKNPPKWVRVYVRFLFILLIAMVFVWISSLQVYNWAILPLMLMLALRYAFLWQRGLISKP